ncbi:MAG: hypothetical protein APU95_05870 [Hadesarchaea archaeon YNP_N21]|jgi:predicted phosphate transport protein (TIGR00153 family)|nr:MAG: hypothetical protein APU95_05870 [Hadesarchaea archaeon YNP_N21]
MFKSISSAIWIGRQREKEILKMCEGHMDKIVETIAIMRKNVHAACDGRAEEMGSTFNEISAKEREADELKRKIVEELSKGIFHPINRDEIVRLILTADDIATNAKATTRRLKLISLRGIDEKLKSGIKEISDNLLEMANLMRKSFAEVSKKPKEAIKLADQVERIEEKIDDLRMDEIMPEVVRWSNRSRKPGTSMILKDVIDHMENVADRCEDVVDVIRSIAISHA